METTCQPVQRSRMDAMVLLVIPQVAFHCQAKMVDCDALSLRKWRGYRPRICSPEAYDLRMMKPNYERRVVTERAYLNTT